MVTVPLIRQELLHGVANPVYEKRSFGCAW